MTRYSPTNTTQRQPRQYTTILTSILIIGLLAIGVFISTEQFYTELSTPTRTIEVTTNLLQTVDTASSKSIGGNSTTSNHLRVQQKDDDDAKHLPITEELFEGANDNNNDGEKVISIAKNEDKDRDLPITDELFEVVANGTYTNGSVDNVTDIEHVNNQGNVDNVTNLRDERNNKHDSERDLPITDEMLEVVANGNYTDVSVDNITNIEDMINQGNESSSEEGGEQISSGKIIEETAMSNDDEEESCFRARRYNKSKSRLSTPFINIGLPKMGSTSLHSYFRCGNYSSVHWLCSETVENGTFCGDCILDSIKADLNPLSKCPSVDSYSQIDRGPENMVQVNYLDEIVSGIPNATFIMTFRNMSKWYNSMSNWLGIAGTNVTNNMKARFQREDIKGLPSGVGNNVSEFSNFYCEYVKRVRRTIAKYPGRHELIEIDIEDPKAGIRMEGAFGVSKSCWGQTNIRMHNLTDE